MLASLFPRLLVARHIVGLSEQEVALEAGFKLQIVNLLKGFRLMRSKCMKGPMEQACGAAFESKRAALAGR